MCCERTTAFRSVALVMGGEYSLLDNQSLTGRVGNLLQLVQDDINLNLSEFSRYVDPRLWITKRFRASSLPSQAGTQVSGCIIIRPISLTSALSHSTTTCTIMRWTLPSIFPVTSPPLHVAAIIIASLVCSATTGATSRPLNRRFISIIRRGGSNSWSRTNASSFSIAAT